MLLIGSCSRARLLRLLENKVGAEARKAEILRGTNACYFESHKDSSFEAPKIMLNDLPVDENFSLPKASWKINR